MPTYEAQYASKSGKVETYRKRTSDGDKWTSAYSDGNLSMGGFNSFDTEKLALANMSEGVAAVVIGQQISEMPLLEEDSVIFG